MTRRRSPQRGQALIIIFVGAFLLGAAGATLLDSGKSANELRRELAKRVPDEARLQRLYGVIAGMEKETERLASEHDRMAHEALDLLAKHDAKREEFESLLARAGTLNADSRKTLLDLRFALRQDLSPEDWRALFPAVPAK